MVYAPQNPFRRRLTVGDFVNSDSFFPSGSLVVVSVEEKPGGYEVTFTYKPPDFVAETLTLQPR